MPDPASVWLWLPIGYLLSVLIEGPILLIGLSARHPIRHRLFAGAWLTACTYPIVIVVMPSFIETRPEGSRALYLLVAETFAPVAECSLFWAAFGTREEWGKRSMWRDFVAITVANLASFVVGEVVGRMQWVREMLGG